MTFNTILGWITYLVSKLLHPGYGNSFQTRSIIWRICNFITTHPLILFFVLLSFLFIGIKLIRRMIT